MVQILQSHNVLYMWKAPKRSVHNVLDKVLWPIIQSHIYTCHNALTIVRLQCKQVLILMLNMEYQFLKLYLLLYDFMVGSEMFNYVN